MMRTTPLATGLTSLLFVGALCHCGGKSLSEEVSLSLIPAQPIVITGPTSVLQNGQSTPVTGPWVSFKINVSVPASLAYPVTVTAVHLEITGVGSTGQSVTSTSDLSPTSDDYTSTTDTCYYQDYGEFDPSGTTPSDLSKVTSATAVNNTTLYEVPSSGSTSGCTVNTPLFVIGGLPTQSTTQTAFNYSIFAQPEGWLGSRTNPQQRFVNYIYAYTQ